MSARGASAGRAEKCTSGDSLTIPLRLGCPAPVRNQLGNWAVRAPVANRRLRGRERLRCIDDLTLRAGRIAPRSDMLRRKLTR